MIHFACLHCGMKFKVKDEFAGRATKCPTCKNPVHVPDPTKTLAYVPADNIEGSESSLDKAGVNPSITLAPQPGNESASVDALAKKQVGRYVIDKEIARGGMGAVLRGVDRDIRREVAIKFMLDDQDAKKKARFVEEAQITGQLEHPNIVPVHELGVDAKKRLFFTMKMVKGRSLAQVLEMLAKDPNAEREWSLGRLLTFLVNICHALAFAHSRKVIHRDLKPANIMIGDFGEVYVMDWGLAKVLGEKTEKAAKTAFSATPLTPASVSGTSVSTSREMEGELTQDGAIMGTPAYMPPEQALGDIQAIDQRSDIYSLGAILYALLTLKPPVEKDGNHVALLMRVVEGDIKKPEVRTPDRHIPAELSAIAMKALAKVPQNRYQTVEAVRRDLELFLEGRSVSAKQDTVREQVWKLVKRNKGASATAALAMLVLTLVVTVSFGSIVTQKAKALDALNAFEKERDDKRKRGKDSAPLFVQDAKVSANRQLLDHALAQVDVALDYDPDLPEARLVKGQLLIVNSDYPAARTELAQYVRQRPQDKEAAELLRLCHQEKLGDVNLAAAFAEIFARQKAYGLAERMEKDKDRLLKLYRGRIEAAWKGRGSRLTMKNGKCHLDFVRCTEVKDLQPLEGLPLTSLSIEGCSEVRDLTPLFGMPLELLDVRGCVKILDLGPLRGMPLTTLRISGHFAGIQAELEDLTALRGLPLTSLTLDACSKLKNLEALQGLPLTSLSLFACSNMKDLGPLRSLKKLQTLNISQTSVEDLSPLQGLPLTVLNMGNCGLVQSLHPLKEMPLTKLDLRWCRQLKDVTLLRELKQLEWLHFPNAPQAWDLGVLRGLPLVSLFLQDCWQIDDLKPLRELKKLTSLSLGDLKRLKDLSALEGLPLQSLNVSGLEELVDLKPLKSMPLQHLNVQRCTRLQDLTPLQGMMTLRELYISGCDRLQDVTPLAELNLTTLFLTPSRITKGMEGLRDMRTLGQLGLGVWWHEHFTIPRAEFWRKYDAGEFKK